MSEARKALLSKIKSKQSENDYQDLPGPGLSSNRPLNIQNFTPPELTIEPARKRPRQSQDYSENDGPEITIIPKYPQLLSSVSPSQESFLSTILVLKKDDYERLLPTNPIFSSYIFLPSLNLFVHPLVFPTQLLSLAPPQLVRDLPVSPEHGKSAEKMSGRAARKQLVVTNSRSTSDGSTFCTLKNFSNWIKQHILLSLLLLSLILAFQTIDCQWPEGI